MERSKLIKTVNENTTTSSSNIELKLVNANENKETNVDAQTITIGGPKSTVTVRDHALLSHLDFEESGHTGFASEKDLNTQVEVDESMQVLPQEAIQALKRNSTIQLFFHDKLYSLSVRAGKLWTYTYIEKTTGDIQIITVDMDSGAFDISSSNPVQHNLDSHINDTSVHLQTGERIAWNNKVSATVDETEEKLIFSSEV